MIDLHVHLLPGIDDGPQTLPEALDMARAAVRAGTRIVVCTPHIDHRWEVEPAAVRDAVDELQAALDAARIPLALAVGGEVAATRAADLDDEALRAVRLGEGDWLLLESPLQQQGELLERMVFNLQVRGFHVLLAHPERSPIFLRDYDRLRRLVDAGARCSVTAGAVLGRFGRPARALAQRMLADGLLHNIASDAHAADRRAPGLGPAVEAAVSGSASAQFGWWLTEGVPGAIIMGEPLPAAPAGPPVARRGWRPWS